ncbi:hypothetical protein C8R44DRAFT_895959 [Mycena epipterygia]|nr:hypothetical protein C8R44DRAFT_895959 [Mycena epipterygia]
MSYYLNILAKFPGVRALYFCGEATVDDPAAQEIRASGLRPVLSEYAGSYHLLDLFLPRPNVTCLTIDFYRDLRSISPLPSITVLDVIFSAFQTPSYICTQLFKYFPELRDLRMVNTTGISRKANENEVASDFLVTLLSARNVPASLTHLAISWDFSYQDDDNMPCAETPQFNLLRDALVAWCPTLTTIWIDTPDFLFKWHKSPVIPRVIGASVNMDENDVDEVNAMRAGFDSFWARSGGTLSAFDTHCMRRLPHPFPTYFDEPDEEEEESEEESKGECDEESERGSGEKNGESGEESCEEGG